MPNPIIPQKLKMLKRILNIPYFWGPVFTVIFTVAYHYTALYFGFSIVTGWIWLLVIVGGFVGGLWAGLLCATWSAAYTLYALGGDPARQVQGIIIAYLMVFLVGWQTRRLRQIYKEADELFNGNKIKLDKGLTFLRQAKAQLLETRKTIELGEDALGNLMAGVVGYKQLRRSMEEVNAWYKDPENIKRLQAWEEIKEEGKQADE